MLTGRIFALVLGQKNQLWWDLRRRANRFSLLRAIYGIPADQCKQTLDELVDFSASAPS